MRSQPLIAAICVNPSATDRKSEPPARRADGAARAIAARTAGTRLDPPVRKIVSIAAAPRPAAAMQSLAVLYSRSVLASIARSKSARSPWRRGPSSRKAKRHGGTVRAAQRDLGVLDRERQAMAEALADDLQETSDLFGFARIRDQLGQFALVPVGCRRS